MEGRQNWSLDLILHVVGGTSAIIFIVEYSRTLFMRAVRSILFLGMVLVDFFLS